MEAAQVVTPVAYQARPMTFDEWTVEITTVALRGTAVAWHIGDLLNYGEAHFGEQYTAILTELEKRYTTASLLEFRRVARLVPLENRLPHDEATWSHHREVAKLTPEQQREWLAKAKAEQPSIKAFRTAMREAGVIKGRKRTETEDAVIAETTCERCRELEAECEVLRAENRELREDA